MIGASLLCIQIRNKIEYPPRRCDSRVPCLPTMLGLCRCLRHHRRQFLTNCCCIRPPRRQANSSTLLTLDLISRPLPCVRDLQTPTDTTIRYNTTQWKKLYVPRLIETYHDGANESSQCALPNSLVLSRLQNVTKVCDGSRSQWTVTSITDITVSATLHTRYE